MLAFQTHEQNNQKFCETSCFEKEEKPSQTLQEIDMKEIQGVSLKKSYQLVNDFQRDTSLFSKESNEPKKLVKKKRKFCSYFILFLIVFVFIAGLIIGFVSLSSDEETSLTNVSLVSKQNEDNYHRKRVLLSLRPNHEAEQKNSEKTEGKVVKKTSTKPENKNETKNKEENEKDKQKQVPKEEKEEKKSQKQKNKAKNNQESKESTQKCSEESTQKKNMSKGDIKKAIKILKDFLDEVEDESG